MESALRLLSPFLLFTITVYEATMPFSLKNIPPALRFFFKISLLWIALSCGILPGLGSWVYGGEGERWIPRIEARFKNPYGFSARFRQRTTSPTLGQEITASGEIAYSPGRILWIYTAPDPATYFLTRTEFYWVQPEERQVVRIPLERAFVSDAPIFLLRGLKELGDLFSLRSTEEEGGILRLTFLPKKPIPQVETLILSFDPGKEWVVEILTLDPAQGSNRFEFREFHEGTKKEPILPAFEIPPGFRLFTPPVEKEGD